MASFEFSDITRAANAARGVLYTADAAIRTGMNIIGNFTGATDYLNRPRFETTNQRNFNITSFTSAASRFGGFIRPSHFIVTIDPPWFLAGRYSHATRYSLPFVCYRAQTPAITTRGVRNAYLGYGTQTFVPTGVDFGSQNTINLDFYLDSTGIVLDIFTKWLQKIVNWNPDAIGTKTVEGAFYNEITYMEEYTSIVNIYMYDATAQAVQEVRLLGAYPNSMSGVNLDWSSSNNIGVLSVAITFQSWTSNFIMMPTMNQYSLRNLSLGSALLSFGSGYGAGSFLGQIAGIADYISYAASPSSGIMGILNTATLASNVTRTLLRL